MADNFRIKYPFEGKEYSSGVSDVYRDKTIYYIFFPVELRAADRLGPQYIIVYHDAGDYKAKLTTPLSATMFKAFLDYIDKQPI